MTTTTRRVTGADVLDDRALNRATLARQLLLRRHGLPVVEAIERVVGLNAQAPNVPYVWAWARLAGFRHDELTRAIEDRRVVRSTLVRATQHVVAAPDFGWLRQVLTPLLARVQRNAFGRQTAGVDLDELAAHAEALLSGAQLTRPELGRALGERWPDVERTALGWSAQYLVPVVHPAPSGTWNVLGPTPFALASEWLAGLGERAGAGPAPEEAARTLVRRYLAGFGPATTSDIRAWSGVAGLKEVVAGMGDELRTFRDERGRTLVDLPDAPRPGADADAPVRLLGEFDDLLLAYHDRSRMMSAEARARVCVGDAVYPTVLVDGAVAALWSVARDDDGAAVLTVSPFARLSPATADAIAAEGADLLAFVHADATATDVRILPPS